MKRLLCGAVIGALCVAMVSCASASPKKPKEDAAKTRGEEAAKAITTITGVAISPLLGVSVVGAWDWFRADDTNRNNLPWYANPAFWLPALLLVGAVAFKDAAGTTLPPGLKKPLDVAEVVENKVSGLVVAGAFVPMIASIFHSSAAETAVAAAPAVNMAGLAAIDLTPLLNVLTIPLAVVAFALVWLSSHVINVLILISPFGAVDAALKSFRTSLIALLALVHFINPWLAAFLSILIIIFAWAISGWAFRFMVFGWVYCWDFFTLRRHRFTPEPNANWMFAARRIEKTPIRTYGQLTHSEDGKLLFEYRPWLVMKKRVQQLPQGKYAVGRGLFFPEIMSVDEQKRKSFLVLPPRYKSHEEELAKIYALAGVEDVGLLKGIKALWRWVKGILGFGARREASAPA